MDELEYKKLSSQEISDALSELEGWEIENGQIVQTFEFDAYKDGINFASAVGYLADNLNHHPDLLITFGKVRVSMHTHDVGGISPFDIELASQISWLY